MSKEEITDLLFAPGFSTKNEISDLSGRGIGLDAGRTSCNFFEMQVKIVSEIEKGSYLEIKIPKKYVLFHLSENFNIEKI